MVDRRDPAPVRVLHLDDHGEYVELSANRLEAVGQDLSVLVADAVDDAVALVESEAIDCLVVPMALDGEAVASDVVGRVRDVAGDLPVVVFDACDPASVASVLEPGQTTYVPKTTPVTDDTYRLLATRIESVVDVPTSSLFDPLAEPLGTLLESVDVPACVLRDDEVTDANPAFTDRFEDVGHGSRDGIVDHVLADSADLREFLTAPTDGERTEAVQFSDGTQRRVRIVTASDGGAVLALWFDAADTGSEATWEETMLHSLMDNMPIAVYFKDEQSRHVRASESLVGMAAEDYIVNPEGKRHVTAASVMGKTDFDLYKTDHAAPAVEDDRSVMETREPIEAREEYTISDDEEDVWLLTTKAPWEDEDGEILGVAGITIEITEQKRRQEQKPLLDQRLEQFERIIARTLMAELEGLKQTLQPVEDPEAAASDAAEQLDDVEALLEDMLELARYSQSPTHLDTISLADVARDVWASTAIAGELDVATDSVILVDEPRLRRLLAGTFRIAGEHGGEVVTVRVGDTDEGFFVEHDGEPLTPEERDRLLDGRYTDSTTGVGLALTLAVGVANANGWQTAVSNDGRRFEFTDVELA